MTINFHAGIASSWSFSYFLASWISSRFALEMRSPAVSLSAVEVSVVEVVVSVVFSVLVLAILYLFTAINGMINSPVFEDSGLVPFICLSSITVIKSTLLSLFSVALSAWNLFSIWRIADLGFADLANLKPPNLKAVGWPLVSPFPDMAAMTKSNFQNKIVNTEKTLMQPKARNDRSGICRRRMKVKEKPSFNSKWLLLPVCKSVSLSPSPLSLILCQRSFVSSRFSVGTSVSSSLLQLGHYHHSSPPGAPTGLLDNNHHHHHHHHRHQQQHHHHHFHHHLHLHHYLQQ